jgi:ribonuclease D
MGLNKLIDAALVVVMLAGASGQLPKLVQKIRVAQLELLKESQSSNWGKAVLLPVSK